MEAPTFIKKIESGTCSEGQSYTFQCQISGTPRPTVTWFKHTSFIKSSEDIEIIYEEDICKLIIKETYLEDSGTYTVVAKNPAGFATCSADLFIEGN